VIITVLQKGNVSQMFGLDQGHGSKPRDSEDDPKNKIPVVSLKAGTRPIS